MNASVIGSAVVFTIMMLWLQTQQFTMFARSTTDLDAVHKLFL